MNRVGLAGLGRCDLSPRSLKTFKYSTCGGFSYRSRAGRATLSKRLQCNVRRAHKIIDWAQDSRIESAVRSSVLLASCRTFMTPNNAGPHVTETDNHLLREYLKIFV